MIAPDEETLKQQVKEDKAIRKAFNRTKKERKKRGIPEGGLTREQSLQRQEQIRQGTANLKAKLQDPKDYGLDILGIKIPSALGLLGTGIGNLTNTMMYNTLTNPDLVNRQEGGYPIFDSQGNIVGVRDKFGRLTGRDPEAELQARIDKMNNSVDEQEEVVQPNPVTGQCPTGYTYDANQQTCVPIFASQIPSTFNYETYMPTPTLLDQPMNLLDVDPMFGEPMDFSYGMPRVRLL